MATPEDYDLVILGSGEAGKCLAWELAARGRRVAVVERKYVGGSCPNVACLPSKSVVHAAKVADYARRSAEFGLVAGGGGVDLAAVRDRKRRMVAGLVEVHLAKFRASGAELVFGDGRFTGPRTVEVALRGGGTRTLRGENVVINTGSRAAIDATPGLRESGPLTHVEALELDRVPGHLVVLGGGPVGLELAQAFRRFGAAVTVIERNPALLHREDADVTDAVAALFADEGVAVSAGTSVERVSGVSGEAVRLHARRGGVEVVVEGTHLLVAAGRTPNTDGLGLELAGVTLDARGHVAVDERLRTAAAGVWAVGDCAGSPQFTHVGYDDFRVVLANLTGGDRVTTGRQVPSCLFTDPELARVGLSERQAQEQGVAYRLAKIPMRAVLRTWTLGEPRGFLKGLVATDSDRILGFTAFGAEAGEVMAVVQVAMAAGLPYTALRDAVLTHPTVAEGLVVLFSSGSLGGGAADPHK